MVVIFLTFARCCFASRLKNPKQKKESGGKSRAQVKAPLTEAIDGNLSQLGSLRPKTWETTILRTSSRDTAPKKNKWEIQPNIDPK